MKKKSRFRHASISTPIWAPLPRKFVDETLENEKSQIIRKNMCDFVYSVPRMCWYNGFDEKHMVTSGTFASCQIKYLNSIFCLKSRSEPRKCSGQFLCKQYVLFASNISFFGNTQRKSEHIYHFRPPTFFFKCKYWSNMLKTQSNLLFFD